MNNTRIVLLGLFILAAALIGFRFLVASFPPNPTSVINDQSSETLLQPSPSPSLSQISSLPVRRVAGIVVNEKELDVEVATTSAEITRGLSGRESFDLDGMLFVFPTPGKQNFWMKDMRFGIDLLWINDGKVVDILRNIPTPEPGTPDSELKTYVSPGDVSHVLELPAGAASDLGIEVSSEIITTDPTL